MQNEIRNRMRSGKGFAGRTFFLGVLRAGSFSPFDIDPLSLVSCFGALFRNLVYHSLLCYGAGIFWFVYICVFTLILGYVLMSVNKGSLTCAGISICILSHFRHTDIMIVLTDTTDMPIRSLGSSDRTGILN